MPIAATPAAEPMISRLPACSSGVGKFPKNDRSETVLQIFPWLAATSGTLSTTADKNRYSSRPPRTWQMLIHPTGRQMRVPGCLRAEKRPAGFPGKQDAWRVYFLQGHTHRVGFPVFLVFAAVDNLRDQPHQTKAANIPINGGRWVTDLKTGTSSKMAIPEKNTMFCCRPTPDSAHPGFAPAVTSPFKVRVASNTGTRTETSEGRISRTIVLEAETCPPIQSIVVVTSPDW